MIRVQRLSPPRFYSTLKYQRMEDDLRTRAESPSQERLKFDREYFDQIRQVLIETFNNKCAYCESQLGVSAEMQIDNFRPKQLGNSKALKGGHYYWLAYQWENLYASCPNCNVRKGNKFPLDVEGTRCRIGAYGEELQLERYLLIDPCVDDPRSHLEFEIGGFVKGRTRRGDATIDILGLNRHALVEARRKAADNLLLKVRGAANNVVLREGMIDEIKYGRSALPYLAMLQKVVYLWESGRVDDIGAINNEPPPSSGQTEPDFAQFSIRRIEISNYKTIGDLTLDIIPQTDDVTQASWLLLLGDNGVGKSTVLQAIALTLAGRHEVKKLKIRSADVLRTGAVKGFVHIYCYERDEPVSLFFDERKFVYKLHEPITYVLGYGTSRNLPKSGGGLRRNQSSVVNIANLFDHTISLRNVEEWMGNLLPEELEFVTTALFDLLDLRNDDHIAFDGELNITRAGHPSTLQQLSEGYKTMLALSCDMMAVLMQENQGYHLTRGIVLIDELGNHLHPRWRVKVVSTLRTAFPLLQFIVSTHEPLCLRGLLHGEVVVLLHDRMHQVRKLDKDLLPDHSLMRVDQLLTSDLFGLLNTLDDESEKKYEDYYALLQQAPENRTDQQQEQINELSSQLANKEIFGATPPMQVLYAVVNETFAKNLREDGFKTKTELKKETIEQVKSMIMNKQIDWF